MTAELVPFGKHKGQPVEVLVADSGYREWLMGQPWFRDRYPVIYQTVVNYAGEPAETPEHNELQASFLDDDRCLALAKLVLREDLFNGRAAAVMAEHRDRSHYESLGHHVRPALSPPKIYAREFEAGGWDVVFTFAPCAIFLELRSLPECLCECDHERDCAATATCRGGDAEYRCRHRHCGRVVSPTFEQWQDASRVALAGREQLRQRVSTYGHCDERCPWASHRAVAWLLDDDQRLYIPASWTVRVECKPDLGDDFPAVLRQVNRHDTAGLFDRRCVVVRRHAFTSVSWEQVSQMFGASGIVLVSEALLTVDAREGER
jgi:hypothetical protein